MPYKDKEKARECSRKYAIAHPEIRKRIKHKYNSTHKEKLKEYSKKYRDKNRDKLNAKDHERYYSDLKKVKERGLLYKYGITLKDYNDIYDAQEGKCAICGIHQSELKLPLGVDHDHITGKIRGLLCRKCNWAIGLLEEDYYRILKCMSYLFTDKLDEHG
jgi:hypothetical protein